MGDARPARRFYDEARSRPYLVMRACSYLRGGKDCRQCQDEIQDGEVYSPACRLLAEEMVAVVAEALDSGPEKVEQDR